MTTTDTSPKPKQKPKSPPTPSWSLKESFQDVVKLYTEYSHASFSKEEIASTLQVKVGTGPFAARLFTLKEYGLIEKSDGGFKVSQLFMTLKSNAQNSAPFKKAAMTAIKRSAVFLDLLDNFKGKLPSKEGVAQRLETQKQFNPERAKEVASVFEDSLKYAGVLDQNSNILPIREDGSSMGMQNDHTSQIDHEQSTNQAAINAGPVQARQQGTFMRSEIPLKDGRRVVVYYPPDLSAEEAEKTGAVLRAITG